MHGRGYKDSRFCSKTFSNGWSCSQTRVSVNREKKTHIYWWCFCNIRNSNDKTIYVPVYWSLRRCRKRGDILTNKMTIAGDGSWISSSSHTNPVIEAANHDDTSALAENVAVRVKDGTHDAHTRQVKSRASVSQGCWSEDKIQATIKLWNLKKREQKDFLELKRRLQDISHWKNSPYEVVRFLRERPGDVDGAERMFRKMVQWRIKHQVDSILYEYQPPKELMEYYPGAILQGVDREGDPIFVGRLGVTDLVGMMDRFGREELIQYAIWVRELVSRGEWVQDYRKQ